MRPEPTRRIVHGSGTEVTEINCGFFLITIYGDFSFSENYTGFYCIFIEFLKRGIKGLA
jgi:hypothetical protein